MLEVRAAATIRQQSKRVAEREAKGLKLREKNKGSWTLFSQKVNEVCEWFSIYGVLYNMNLI